MAKNDLLGILACLHINTILFVCLGGFYLFAAMLFSPFWVVALLYAAWWYYDRDTPYRAGRRVSWLRNFFIWRHLANYFPAKLHKTVDLDPSKNYLFALHPHGFVVFGGFVNFVTNATGVDEMFPGIKIHVLSANLHFKSPFYREYAIAGGIESVNAESIDYKLTQIGPGHSVLLAPGGNVEMMLSDHKSYTLKLKSRKGFIRRALKTGASVVPVFTFNEHRLYEIPVPEEGTLLGSAYQFMKRCTGVVLPIVVRGRWKWAGHLVPRQVPLDTVVGAPLDFADLKSSFPKGQDPPEEVVDQCHKIYMEALEKLYNENKSRFGDESTPLIFV